ncbi:DUF1622 domain-containing protein [Streptomyces goshikiensis]|uniref:DUF1622 domain-containing protein n=1 Tax=Streptomyces goshikiensis TaxID=1942 RepID=A0ABZ1RW97_9ACTN|nr:hypothetical protein [Streptomyces goshikiensis]
MWLALGPAGLAAIAAIQTLLNFFLTREIAKERAEIDQDRQGSKPHFATL